LAIVNDKSKPQWLANMVEKEEDNPTWQKSMLTCGIVSKSSSSNQQDN